ncbi:hypothetical protein [Anaerocolumna sp. MB42-C2]|uniref:hypothetical protein n=1 Tax=Anaerocolumna sp. MB42-C2 TaxID=3070997 RepID=UPI0027E1D366|nr:hypothetical protein [Anaerocolumna sp. MB42-C2]WMJ86053.1 hypothetical protein RBU59_18690 [Anaerocolumna sp. MB42-C2]
MKNSKAAVVIYRIWETVEYLLGAMIATLFGLVALVGMFDHEEDGAAIIIIISWLFTALGLWLIQLGRKRKILLKNFREYVTRLSLDPTGSIENLAASINTSQDVVKDNLQIMINKKFFVDAYIDEINNRVVFQTGVREVPQYNEFESNIQNQYAEYVTVTCKSCGGINKVLKDKVGECEYCGSPIKN